MTASPPVSPQNDGEPKSRLDRELEEILSRNDNILHLPPPPKVKPQRKPTPRPTVPPKLVKFVSTPMVSAVLIALVAYFLRDVSQVVANVLCFLAVACIIWPVVQRLRQPQQAPGATMWRGQVYQMGPPAEPTIVDSLRTWWNSRKR